MNMTRDVQTKLFNRINPAVAFSVKRYVLSIGFFLAVLIFGIITMTRLGVDQFPAINNPVVTVVTSYPGAVPSVVDQQITQLIEGSVSTLSGITDINSDSSTGNSRVRITFESSINKDSAANQVSSRVAAVTRRLPTGINPPTVQTFDPNSRPIVQFGIEGGGADLAAVTDYIQNELSPNLLRLPGVANVQIDGGPAREYQVLLNPDRLQYYNLNTNQVVTAITNAAVNLPIGSIVSNKNSVSFVTKNVPSGLDQIGNFYADQTKGVFIRDIASVRQVAVTSSYARVNGIPSVLVSIQKTFDGNSVAVADTVRQFMDANPLPKGYAATFSNDTTGAIKASVESTGHEFIITALVVALICLLFLGKLHTALSVILAIPIALSAAPVLYGMMGFTFNLVSLLALIVAIGIVVDDSIVVSENVERYRHMGFTMKESVLKGASEVFSAVVAASLSLLSVLLPISFMGGIIGSFIMQFSLGLVAAVFFSLLEALLFLTIRMAYLPETHTFDWKDFLKSFIQFTNALKWGFKSWRKAFGIIGLIGVIVVLIMFKLWWALIALPAYPIGLFLLYYFGRIALTLLQVVTTPLHNATEWVLGKIRDGYAKVLTKLLPKSLIVLLTSVGIIVGTILFFVFVSRPPFSFIPQTDAGTLQVNVRMPNGTASSSTNEVASRVEKILSQQPEVTTIQTVITGANANITVQLVPIEERKGVYTLIPAYRTNLRAATKDSPSARVSVSAGGGFQGQGSSVQISLLSADFDKLVAANAKALQLVQTNQWVDDVTSALSNTTTENAFVPNLDAFKGTGITPSTVGQILQTYTTGTQATTVQIGGLSYPLNVKINPNYLADVQSLLNLPIYSTTLTSNLRVGQLGDFKPAVSPQTLTRLNRQYAAELTINLKPNAPPSTQFTDEMKAFLTDQGLFNEGVSLSAGSSTGPAALAAQLSTLLPRAFLLALFLAYLVMAAQFNSWRYPIYLLLPVPLAIIGALWLVYALGVGLDIFGFLGTMMLIGLSAKNAILYLDFVVERLGKIPFDEALIDSARLRFRPIIMTTLTVLVISFPLMFGTGQGSEFGQRMGIVMFGGIVSSAILTFFVVPAAFWLFEQKKWRALENSGGTPEPMALAKID